MGKPAGGREARNCHGDKAGEGYGSSGSLHRHHGFLLHATSSWTWTCSVAGRYLSRCLVSLTPSCLSRDSRTCCESRLGRQPRASLSGRGERGERASGAAAQEAEGAIVSQVSNGRRGERSLRETRDERRAIVSQVTNRRGLEQEWRGAE